MVSSCKEGGDLASRSRGLKGTVFFRYLKRVGPSLAILEADKNNDEEKQKKEHSMLGRHSLTPLSYSMTMKLLSLESV